LHEVVRPHSAARASRDTAFIDAAAVSYHKRLSKLCVATERATIYITQLTVKDLSAEILHKPQAYTFPSPRCTGDATCIRQRGDTGGTAQRPLLAYVRQETRVGLSTEAATYICQTGDTGRTQHRGRYLHKSDRRHRRD
jgi:hypothetical protein